MKKFLLSLLMLPLLAIQVSAQAFEPVAIEEVVTIKGQDGTIVFEAYIEPGFHMYSTDELKGGPLPTTISFRVVEGAELVGGLTSGASAIKKFDSTFNMNVTYFEETAEFTQKIKLLGGKYRLQGTLRFQSCEDGGDCVQGRYDFDITGEAEGSKVVVTPMKKEDMPKPIVPNLANTADKPVEKAAVASVAPAKKAEEKVTAVEQPEVQENPVVKENVVANDSAVVEVVNEQVAGNLWAPVIDKMNEDTEDSSSLWLIFVLGFGGGLVALLTPCVWPIIPMTVSFFLKRSKQRSQAVREAIIYGVSIILIYLLLGIAVTLIFGAGALNALSTNAIFNIFFFLMLLTFGASFLGGFELTLPSSWTNKVDEKAGSTTGMLSIFLMAFTLVLVSFSCTGPIIGFLLVEVSTSGEIMAPALGMFGFALALALPFTVFALFPSLLKQTPRSGGWMNTIKVVLGFVEIAFALKFLSVADLSYHWGLLDRETFLALWIVLFALLGLYLLKIIRFPHDDASDRTTSVTGFFAGVISLAFAIYMIPGLWGAPCKAVSAFAPPMSTQDFSLYDNSFKPHTDDFETAIEMARREGKPILLDFTGHGCVNCRNMEASVWSDDRVIDIMRDKYIVASLYVDDRTPLAEPFEAVINGKKVLLETVGDKWTYLQNHKFGGSAQPFYVPIDNDANPLCGSYSFNLDVEEYVKFLEKGLDRYNK